MKITVFSLIIKITLVLSDSHNDINTTVSQNATTTIDFISTIIQQELQIEKTNSTIPNTASTASNSSPITTPITTTNSTFTISPSCSSNDTSTKSIRSTTVFFIPNSTLSTNKTIITTSATVSSITDFAIDIRTNTTHTSTTSSSSSTLNQLISTTTHQKIQNETPNSTISNTSTTSRCSSTTPPITTINSTFAIPSRSSNNTSTESTPATTKSPPNSTLFTNSTTPTPPTSTTIQPLTTDTETGYTTPFYSSFSTDDWPNTKILTKKGFDLKNHADPSIKITSPADGDFQTFIQDSTFWVDKSLLIRKLWESMWKLHIVITAPPKWGKTITLSMIKFHCDLSLDSNGFEMLRNQSISHLYFNLGKIVKKDGTIEELNEPPSLSGYNRHLANHPVIFISGSNLRIDNSLESFQIMIHETFKRHSSLLNRLKILYSKASSHQRSAINKNMTEFQAFYDLENIRQLNETYLVRGIQILSRLLSDAYQRKVIVIFDNYDQYAQKAYFEGNPLNITDNGTQFYNLWELFLRNSFKLNTYLEKAILAGVLKAKDPSTLPGYPNYFSAYVFDDDDLFPYFGFFEIEFLQMATKRGLDQNVIKNATQWYGGYRTLSNLGYQMYSPYSVAQFMSTLQIRDYWPTSILSEFIKRLLRKPECQHRIRDLVEHFGEGKSRVSPLLYRTFKSMDLKDYADIQKIDLGEVEFAAGIHEYEVFSLLVSSGYIAVFEHNREQVYILVKVPNREICSQINSVINS